MGEKIVIWLPTDWLQMTTQERQRPFNFVFRACVDRHIAANLRSLECHTCHHKAQESHVADCQLKAYCVTLHPLCSNMNVYRSHFSTYIDGL